MAQEADVSQTIKATNDAGRGWMYFNLLFEEAGVPLNADVEAALAELHAYHQESNLWEFVPSGVFPAPGGASQRAA